MQTARWVSFSIGAAAVLALVAAIWMPAAAQGRLTAQLHLTQAQIPPNLNEAQLIQFARRNRAAHLQEVTDVPVGERSWVANLVVAFNRPIGDLEFHVLFYDVHDGAPRFIEEMTTFVSDRRQKTFVQLVRLDRPDFRPNRDMELVVTVQRSEVARLRFGVVGEAIRHSGEVNFTDEEVQNPPPQQ